uniref:AlNc14C11G1382 protein n=1 Tax=Albugo laibachii Nc14 TaxID=890382 RepID=F0W303_9STRA|nr:AlNc14C11G1382 [Albugo laibachii Nc14]|eukprot:CCA15440.1 AlNc14C11G1382 [Albugo laibachii Nc14]
MIDLERQELVHFLLYLLMVQFFAKSNRINRHRLTRSRMRSLHSIVLLLSSSIECSLPVLKCPFQRSHLLVREKLRKLSLHKKSKT